MAKQPILDASTLLVALKHRDENPMDTKEQIITWARQKFPADQYINSLKFASWIDGGKGSMAERELHVSLMKAVSFERMASETQQANDDRDQALMEKERAFTERDEAKTLAETYREEANEVRLQLALMTAPPEPIAV